MRLHKIIYLAATLLLFACHRPVEPLTMVGFIEHTDNNVLTIANDTARIKRFQLTESTILDADSLVEGNIVEIIYLPTEEQTTIPTAQRVTSDATYIKALGRWTSEDRSALPVDITLLPHGRITQSLPTQTLQYTRWELTGEQDLIILHGTLSLPPTPTTSSTRKEREPITPPSRRPYNFSVQAHLSRESDNNTESRRVMIIQADNGTESKLYFQSGQ